MFTYRATKWNTIDDVLQVITVINPVKVSDHFSCVSIFNKPHVQTSVAYFQLA
jgi:hypothetical protein